MPFSTMQSDSGNFPSLKTPDSVANRPFKPQLPATPAQEQENLPCPRCDSTNTKFCYYNNYNLSQPRHFCKSCRRYWTKGGALRNIPIGGGSRKNKRPTPPKPSAEPVESETAMPAVFGENDGILDVTGTFGSLLASSGCFGYLGEPFANGWSLGYGKQLSSAGSLGLDGTWSLREMDESGGIGNSWQSDNSVVVGDGGGGGGGGEGFEGDCWVANVWPELAISAPGKGLQ